MLLAISPNYRLKPWHQIIVLLAATYFLLFRLLPAVQNHYTPSNEQDPLPEHLDPRTHLPLYSYPETLTTNLIIASTLQDNITWTSHLRSHLPNLKVYRYISDSPDAQFHPPTPNKGREALMYFAFLRDFHDSSRTSDSEDDGLADINIFIHADESPWHADSALLKSMLFTITHLNLNQVLKNEYVNLRTTWGGSGEHSCPDGGFNTSKTYEEGPVSEEYWMREAFEVNFPGEDVPEILAGPCCSQFAVTRKAIQSRGKEVYERAVGWLVDTDWPDQLVGRVWEHMWPWLFKSVAGDCGDEVWRTLCERFGVCFEGSSALNGFEELWAERKRLREDEIGFWKEVLRPGRVRWAKDMVEIIGATLEGLLIEAVASGQDWKVREAADGDRNVKSEGQD